MIKRRNRSLKKSSPRRRERRTARLRRRMSNAAKALRCLMTYGKFLQRFVVYPSAHAHAAHVLWVAHAHLMAAWECTPRIAFLSPEPAIGKTRSMEVSELLVPDPVAAVNVTPAYLFRKCGSEDGPPTILFDEIDTVFGAKAREHEELRALLNSGHRRGAKAGRCVVRGKIVETEEISSYGAVALAGLGWLPETILSRSIIIRMRRRVPPREFERSAAASTPRKARLAPAPGGLGRGHSRRGNAGAAGNAARSRGPRRRLWEPLLALADIAGGEWPKRAREAAAALVAVAREIEPSLNLRLLADLRTVFGKHDKHDALYTKTILAELHRLEDAPWDDIKGKPLSDNQLARRLGNYDVKPKDVRIDRSSSRAIAAPICMTPGDATSLPCPRKALQARQGQQTNLFKALSAAARNPNPRQTIPSRDMKRSMSRLRRTFLRAVAAQTKQETRMKWALSRV